MSLECCQRRMRTFRFEMSPAGLWNLVSFEPLPSHLRFCKFTYETMIFAHLDRDKGKDEA